MNDAYQHLIWNHFPPVLAIAAIVVVAIGMFLRNDGVRRGGVILIVLAAITAIPSYMSGEGAEEIVETLVNVNRAAIEPHEEWGEATLILLSLAGIASLAVLVAFRNREIAAWALAVVILFTLAATVVAIRTALLGGKIRHPETAMRPQ